MGQFRLRI